MQIGISSYTYGWAVGVPGNRPDRPLNEQALLDRALRFGVRVVQIGDNWPLHELPTDRLAALRKRATETGIALEVGARGLRPEHLYRYIDLTHRLGSRLLRFVIDARGYEPDLDSVTALLREAEPTLREKGVTLGLENHDRLKAVAFADLIERVGSPCVGICLDSVNSMGAGEGLAEVVATLAPYTVNLHLKDFGIRRLPHLQGFQIDGRIAGQGMLNVPWLVGEVARSGRCRTAVLEQWVVPEPDMDDTIAREARWAEESISYLKTINGLTF
ncbi:sugar phosphate isomerase/epimerase family protein [Larkinella soli]|uniref:sugar phosphate isomerase/epimerase family protein n=1 Tax=Larkinella soli TaxID=1770527 RepID=UPI000FFB4A54|nr:TIM barrel protein [Larkinella soli]